VSLWLYRIATWLLAPLFLLQLAWRARVERSGTIDLAARLGFGSKLIGRSIWIHAVSVGEVQAAATLVLALRERHSHEPIVVTCVTPTGMAHARRLFAAQNVTLRFLPLDLPGAVHRFLDRIQPQVGIVLETEIWPRLFWECGERGIPIILASARLSERSVARYRRLGRLLQQSLAAHVTVAAQSDIDAERFRSLGVPSDRVSISGNLKFDFSPTAEAIEQRPELQRTYSSAQRFVWIAASTHEGEESAVLGTQQRLKSAGLDPLLIIAPRHPRRFDSVAKLIEESGLAWARVSQLRSGSLDRPISRDTSVILLDTLGDLLAHYGLAQAAFIGGSWVAVGGHNLLEPLAMGAATLTGPQLFNSPEVARNLSESGAVTIVADAHELEHQLWLLSQDADERERRGVRARMQLDSSRGALQRVLALVEARLESMPR
jgi:3-deoxy-D-manno-octulosonic-acid transferase